MKRYIGNFGSSTQSVFNSGLDWALLTLAPLPVLLLNGSGFPQMPHRLYELLTLLSVLLALTTAYFIQRSTAYSRISGFLAIVLTYALAYPFTSMNPFYTLFANILFIGVIFFIIDIRPSVFSKRFKGSSDLSYNRARLAINSQTVIMLVILVSGISVNKLTLLMAGLSFLISYSSFIWRAYMLRQIRSLLFALFLLALALATAVYILDLFLFVLLLINLILSFKLSVDSKYEEHAYQWWEALISHPARILFSTFFLLCLCGTFFLLLPLSSTAGHINTIDAFFTAVSAVCVTGLIVLDTPNDFTLFGQVVILLLIQLGGLGIMTITTIAIHSLGRRISLKHEAILTSMTDTDHKSLITSLSLILKYTLFAEFSGAVILTGFFVQSGDSLNGAVWRGIFTSVSAFCNAGFALQSDSLIGYNSSGGILITIALLIITGGLAPAVAILVPSWCKGRKVPLTVYLSITVSLIMIVSGTLFLLIFEWSTSLYGMNFWEKLLNAFFQSVTLRTAGFNSVDLTVVSSPAFVLMLIFMFIGGSPGGTAGGVKTTTIAVLLLTFWANINGRSEILLDKRRIPDSVVSKAVTIIISGFIVWFIALIMLEVTQQIPIMQLVFEVTSAVGTVGLSQGATGTLDEIGKVIIAVVMFAGRIGPVSLFAFLEKNSTTGTEYMTENITLT